MASIRVPDGVPLPSEDCNNLHDAFKGWGTDEKAIIRVLGCRNSPQRRKIREAYQQIYNESLIDQLHSELSGDFRKAVILWTYDPPERDARLAFKALKSRKKGITQLQVIVEIACATSPHHLVSVRQAYHSLFDCSLEEDIAFHVPLPVRKVLVGLVSSYRYDKEVVDSILAILEADKMREAIETKHLDLDEFLWILSTRNVFQLKATFQFYQQKYGNSFYQDIKICGKGLLESILRVVILCIDAPEKHFAEYLALKADKLVWKKDRREEVGEEDVFLPFRNSMERNGRKVIRAAVVGLGTDEDSLTRAIVSRAEIDMMKIRGEYFNMNKTSLDNAVAGDTSGDYRNFLMTLLGAKI